MDTGWISIGVVGGETVVVAVVGDSLGVAGGVATAVTTRGRRMVGAVVKDTAERILRSSGEESELLRARVSAVAMVEVVGSRG